MADQDLTLDATLLGGDGTLGGATLAQTDELLEHARRSTARPELPGYALSSRLGAGTFGEAWAGEQLSTGQKVAVKIISRAASLDILRFRQEVQRLIEVAEHPNVVTLLDANLDHVPPFFVMPLLANSLADVQAPAAQVAVWFEQVAEGLRYIHSKGILHGDLKPANILLDGEGRARLADFGQSFATQDGGYNLGTIGFMAPEQIQRALRRNQLAADERWDIYALGASIYKMLTGEIPRLDSRARASLATIGVTERLQVCVELSQGPLKPIRSLNKDVDHDLAAIVEGCLEVIPSMRYSDANAVLEDLRRRQDQLPLNGLRPWTTAYRTRTFYRRYSAGVGIAALGIVLLLASVFAGWGEIRRQAGILERERKEMAAERASNDQAKEAAAAQMNKLVDLEANFAGLAARKGHLDEAALWWGRALASRPDDQALWLQLQSYPFALASLLETRAGQPALAVAGQFAATWGDGGLTLFNLATETQETLLHPPGVQRAALSQNGRWLATAADWGEVRLWEVATGRQVRSFRVRTDADPTTFVTDPATLRLTALGFSPSGSRLAVGTGSGETCVFEVGSGRLRERFRVPGAVQELALPEKGSPLVVTQAGEGYLGSRRLAVAGARHVQAEGDRAAFFGSDSALVALPDGRLLAGLGAAEQGSFWEGRVVAAGRTVTVAHAQSGRLKARWRLADGYRPLAVSDSGFVAAVQGDAARVFDAENGQPVSGFLWHRARLEAATFTTDGELATLAGGRLRVFQDDSEHGYRPQWTRQGSVVAIGEKLAAMATKDRLLVTDPSTGTPVGKPLKLPSVPDFLTFTLPEEAIVKCGRRLRRWTPQGAELDPEPADVVAVSLEGPPELPPARQDEVEGEEPEVVSVPREARIICADGREVRVGGETFLQPRPPRALAFLNGLPCLADERQLQVGRGPRPPAVIPGRFEWLAESGGFLVAGEKRRLVLVQARDEQVAIPTSQGNVYERVQSYGKVGAATSPSDILCHAVGQGLVLVGTRSGVAQAYRLVSPLPSLGEPLEHQAPVAHVAVGQGLVATADTEGRIYMWTMPQGFRIFASRPGEAITGLAFGPSGDLFVCVAGKTTCWRFPDRVCEPAAAERFAERLTGFTLDARQMLRPLSPQEWRDRAHPEEVPTE